MPEKVSRVSRSSPIESSTTSPALTKAAPMPPMMIESVMSPAWDSMMRQMPWRMRWGVSQRKPNRTSASPKAVISPWI